MRTIVMAWIVAGLVIGAPVWAASSDGAPTDHPAVEKATSKAGNAKSDGKTAGSKSDDGVDHSGGTIHCDLCTTYCTRTVCEPKCRNEKYACGTHSCNCRPGA